MQPPASPVYAAIVFSSKSASVGLSERVQKGRRLSGAGFETVVGTLADQLVAAAWPADASEVDFHRTLSAMIAAYRPQLVIGAGFSSQLAESAPVGSVLLADRVTNREGDSLRLVIPAASSLAMATGALCESSEGMPGAAACNLWAYPFAQACGQCGLPTAIVTVVGADPNEQIDAETANVLRQSSAAARAGAVLRAAFLRPTSLATLIKRKSRGWEHQEALAEAIEMLLQPVARAAGETGNDAGW